MAIHDQQDGAVVPTATDVVAQDALLTGKGAARRRFSRKAAGAGTGVILTLASQPGMAAVMCAKPSLDQSLAPNGGTRNWNVVLSRAPGTTTTCTGLTPAAWAKVSKWPCIPQYSTVCSPTFTCGTNTKYASAKMGDLLIAHTRVAFDASNSYVGAYLVATYLNVVSGRVTIMNIEDVKKIWLSVITKGYFNPTPDVRWNVARVVEYLKTTMIA